MKFARSIKQISGMSGELGAIMAHYSTRNMAPLFLTSPEKRESTQSKEKADGVFNGNPMHKKLWSSFFS